MVSRDLKTVWRWSDFICKGFDVKSKALQKDLVRAFSKSSSSKFRDSGIGIRLGSGFKAGEFKWWKATVAGFETVRDSFKVDEGSFSDGYRGEKLKVRVFLSL
ncbi:hypothetical protein V6N13_111057 [Hibiscus sabdariffa]